ncbi:MAG: UvrD-helicase domain-containing protein [Flavobacteriales bacterium]|nr:UvrD-helicase domain-containing protein [Flavobacteriales bacterium]
MPFKIYRSSAGSGKTFTLVKEYLRLALSSDTPDRYRGILAITFTNKAAEEMKSRVIEVLAELSSESEPEKEHPMAELLRKELAVSESVLKSRAQRTLKHMLHHYSDISISTIDHFTHNVIRTFAQDLGLSINFEVELDTERITNAIVSELLQKMGSDTVLTNALIDVVQSQIDDEKSWSIDELLKKFALTLFNEESRFHLEKLKNIDLKEFNQLRQKLRNELRETAEQLKVSGKEFNQLLKNNGLEAGHFAGGSTGISNFFKKLSDGKFDPPTATVLKNIEADKWHGSKAKASEKSAIDGLKSQILERYNQALDKIRALIYYEIVFNQIYGVALLDEMQRIQRQLQEDEELLHIGEFNHLVSNVVMTETAPFIYERIGHRYKHFLVDEFQDTSVLQWFNLLPLIDESLAHDNLCLVVGDAKQSIYRWRGGDVQQFVELPDIHRTEYLQEQFELNPETGTLIAQREVALKSNAQIENLDHNYRSSSTVVNFNNSLFSALKPAMPEALQKMYDGNEQKPFSKKEGLVAAKFFRQEDNERTWPEYDELVLEQLQEWVKECIADGFAPGDIAIICRANKDLVKTAQFLIENGLKVVSNESLLINSSPMVRLLVNLATFISAPDDRINIAEMMQHLGMVRNETELTSERLMQMNQKDGKTAVLSLLNELYPNLNWNQLKQGSLFGVFEHLKYALFEDEQDAYLTFFMDEVLSFGKSKTNDLASFLTNWLEKRGKLSIALSENSEAIRLLTIHKSKGLEFPVVMHPFADYKDESTGNSIWVYADDEKLKPLDRLRISTTEKLTETPFSSNYEHEKSLGAMDMFNMLYVALTRPVNRLYVSGKLKKDNATDPSPSTAIQFVFEHLTTLEPTVLEELSFTTGVRAKIEQEKKLNNGFQTKAVGNPFWKQRISISRPSKDRWKTTNPNDARNLGILIHEAMANIKTSKDVDSALSLLVEDGRISVSETESLAAKIRHLMEKDELSALYSEGKQIRNEADIQLNNGKWVRPDRVVFSEEQAWVLDYKTGEELSKHHQQMTTYKEAMHELGFKQVEGLLVYLDEERIVTV